ncbi:MAG TPA: zinc ABC transporter substrate-binding protein [Gaiellaceae bacterium]|nr:zinc ABC transporter substrate-binding protein [Gaiellaceae bacterium]
MKAIIILVCIGILAAGCGESSRASGKTRVVAAFYPLAFATQEIGGDKVDVVNLTPAGAEPHDLEVTPSAVRQLRGADLVLLLGYGFQPQLEKAAGGSGSVLLLLDTPGLNRYSNGDPHVWLDPVRFSLIVKRIGSALHAPGPTQRLVARLHVLDGEYRRGLAHCARREIVTSHEAFAYLGERYGLRQVAITGLTPEAEPSPKDLQRVVSLVRSTHATTIFFETLVSPRIAQTVAHETGAKTAVLNPIEGLKPSEAKAGEDYFTVMRSNLAHLRTALGCR